MPRLIDPGGDESIGLDELAEALDQARWNLREEDSVAALAPLLARLARDPAFLGEHAAAVLASGSLGQDAAGLRLRERAGRYVLRAALWPTLEHAAVRSGGAAPFGYGVARNHTTPILAAGCLGPGACSEDYLFDGVAHGLVGEPAGLEPAGRTLLAPGRVTLYRAHRDVRLPLPPTAFSVSLELALDGGSTRWRSAYRFDPAANTIAAVLAVTASEALVTLAVHFGGDGAIGLVHDLAGRHPATRMRTTALAALGSVAQDDEARAWIYALAADDPDQSVAAYARARLREIAP